jgi:tripartite-type tricarboxylate transporter receptor subunit TctC
MASLLPAAVLAAEFPISGKPVRLVVPFPPGSDAFDGTARVVAQRLSVALNTPVVVDNRPGAGTVIGNQMVASSAPDGHTLLYGVWTSFTMLPHQLAQRPYDELRAFTPITQVARSGLVLLANASVPAGNVQELIAYAKANPGKLSFASWQFGGLNHVYLEMLKADAGLQMVHVPYKGPPDALRDLIEGRVQLMMGAGQAHLAHVRAGKLRSIAAASPGRIPGWQDVPTFAEQGLSGYDQAGGIAVFGPAKMPHEVVRRLNEEFGKILRSPDVIELFTRAVPSFEVEPSTPEALSAFVKSQHEQMGAVIRRLGIRID